jgi:hypothetical protein
VAVFEKWREKKKLRIEAVNKAREDFTSWFEISQSKGWKAYEEEVNKEIEIIKNKIDEDTSLTGEDLKRLQLALQVWKKVQRIPKKLGEKAKGGK